MTIIFTINCQCNSLTGCSCVCPSHATPTELYDWAFSVSCFRRSFGVAFVFR